MQSALKRRFDHVGEWIFCVAVGIGLGRERWVFVGASLAAVVLLLAIKRKHQPGPVEGQVQK
jgi:hypothetical protein